MFHIDDETLREVLDDPEAARRRLIELEQHELERRETGRGEADDGGGATRLREQVVLLRLLGRLEEAERLGRRALACTRDGRREVAAALRLAHVLQWQRRFAEADELFTGALRSAEVLDDALLRAFAHQHYGKSLFDQGRFAAAERHFSTALRLRTAAGAPEDQTASSRQARAAAADRLR